MTSHLVQLLENSTVYSREKEIEKGKQYCYIITRKTLITRPSAKGLRTLDHTRRTAVIPQRVGGATSKHVYPIFKEELDDVVTNVCVVPMVNKPFYVYLFSGKVATKPS